MQDRCRLLITGGSGFIGSEVTRLSLESDYDILNLDVNEPRVSEYRKYWVSTDICDKSEVNRILLDFCPDKIIHLASDIDVNLRALDEFKTTIAGTRNVITSAERLPQLRRFVHVSTQYVVTPGIIPKSEREYIPYTVYGEAKAETEKLVRSSSLSDWVIARPTIIWGPHHPSFAQQIWRRMAEGTYRHPDVGKPLMRGYGYVSNTARQMTILLDAERSKLTNEVYYLGDGMLDYDTWADAFCFGLTGKRAKRISANGLLVLGLIGSGMRRLGLRAPYDLGRYFRMTTPAPIDFTPILELAGPSPISFETGVERSLEWLKGLRV